MARISAQGPQPNSGMPLTQQAAAIYELQHFKEYAYASVPILEDLRNQFTSGNAPPLLLKAIDDTLTSLKS